MSKKKTELLPVDPGRPDFNVEIGGAVYRLYFDFHALAVAERQLAKSGHPTNMLAFIDLRNVNAQTVAALFFAGLLRHRPEMTPEEAERMITLTNLPVIYAAIVEAYLYDSIGPRNAEKEERTDPPADHAG